jgi:hypothetical protein
MPTLRQTTSLQDGTIKMRSCVDCGKDISDLQHRAKRCKECQVKHKKQYSEAWNKANSEKISKAVTKYREKNPIKVLDTQINSLHRRKMRLLEKQVKNEVKK